MKARSLAELKSSALRLATNCRGWRTKRRLLVIESDDWGAIRMPSRQAWQALLSAGIRVDRSLYDSLDCLESFADLEALLNVIGRHRDLHGRPTIFTFNTVMGNPDFEAIEQCGFETFRHQHLFESYRRYHGKDLEPAWRQGMEQGLIRPQLHAREHLNSPLWMRSLKAGHSETRLAFTHRFYGLKTATGSPNQKNYLAACWPDSPAELEAICSNTLDGADLFERTFGYRSKTFIACNYAWPEALEKSLSEVGVTTLQTQRGRVQPDAQRGGWPRIRRHHTGQKNLYGQHYSVRNVLFEPYLDAEADWAGRALAEINQAFRLNRPAILCSHRINYVGGMDLKHRDRSLRQLDDLLTRACHRWPEIEFITSDELSELMKASA